MAGVTVKSAGARCVFVERLRFFVGVSPTGGHKRGERSCGIFLREIFFRSSGEQPRSSGEQPRSSGEQPRSSGEQLDNVSVLMSGDGRFCGCSSGEQPRSSGEQLDNVSVLMSGDGRFCGCSSGEQRKEANSRMFSSQIFRMRILSVSWYFPCFALRAIRPARSNSFFALVTVPRAICAPAASVVVFCQHSP